jgi:hypothetical protein
MRPVLVIVEQVRGHQPFEMPLIHDDHVAAHLKDAFPTVVPPIRHQRCAMLRERRSFAVEDLTVDTDLLESARQAGYTTKVFFISTQHRPLRN